MDEEVENAEIVMTTLNGLPRSWDSFIQGICARKNLVTFSRLWEECSQEEARIVSREEKMGSEYQALTIHSKKIRQDYHQSKEDTLQEIVPRIRRALTGRRETKEDIILTLQKMMNL